MVFIFLNASFNGQASHVQLMNMIEEPIVIKSKKGFK